LLGLQFLLAPPATPSLSGVSKVAERCGSMDELPLAVYLITLATWLVAFYWMCKWVYEKKVGVATLILFVVVSIILTFAGKVGILLYLIGALTLRRLLWGKFL
jgi:hypothetical protein